MTVTAAPDVVVVGTGFSGLCMAIRLQEAGFDDFVVLEKASEVGGTWRENTYPGCGCDVMSLMYSFSFAPNRRWTRMYARQPEILDYIRRIVDDYGLAPHIRYDAEVVSYDFDETDDRWTVRTASGAVYRPRVVVAGPGPLHKPSIPAFTGRERFAGRAFHSAEWDHAVDLTGRHVAVIGTGASAAQFVPEVAKQAAHVDVFQRTAHWILPKRDRRFAICWSHESLIAGFVHPRLMTVLGRAARGLLRRQVPDPDLQRDNVDLVTAGIAEFTASGIRTVDGVEHPADVAVFGTGFDRTDRFEHEHIAGRGGLTIQDAWRDGMEAYLGVAVSGFPNFFLMMGPNSGGGNRSIVFAIEAQARYILECLRAMRERGATRIEVRAGTQRDFNRRIHGKLEGSVWNSGGCDSWYPDRSGRNRADWPGSSASYWRQMRRPDLESFDLSSAAERDEEDYRGHAVLDGAGLSLDVDVHLAGHLDPIDGCYHWYGQVRGDERVAHLTRPDAGVPTLRIGAGPAVDATLTERDPWGHFRVTGVGSPPFALDGPALDTPE